jgi:hypothetical protein
MWLVVPIVLLNAGLMRRLPRAYQADVFWHGIPAWIKTGENVTRILVFVLPLFMRLDVSQKAGLALYAIGVLVYSLAWLAEIVSPRSAWSTSAWGFMAPGYTPALWLAGIGLIGKKLFVPVPYTPWVYVALSAAFLMFHNLHASIVYRRTIEGALSRGRRG